MSHNPIRPWRNIDRRHSRQIHVGNVPVGGGAPISVQTMTNTDSSDVKATVAQVLACAEAGADIIGIGDAAASLIGPKFYQEYVWPFEERLVKAIHQMGADVRLHICGKTTRHLEGMGKLKCNIVDLDYMVDMAEGRDKMGPKQVLLGNIDPVSVLKNGTPEQITNELEICYRATAPRYIVSAGCEVPRGTPPENMVAMRKFAESAIANHGGSLQLSSN